MDTMTETMDLVCPKCRGVITVRDDAEHAPVGQTARIHCPHCDHRGSVPSFDRARQRQDRTAAKAIHVAEKRRLAAERILSRQRSAEDRTAAREAFRAEERAQHERHQQQEERRDAQHRETTEQTRLEKANREAELEAGRALNKKDIEAIKNAVRDGIKETKPSETIRAVDGLSRVAAGFICLGLCMGAGESADSIEGICLAIAAAMFFWFTFRK